MADIDYADKLSEADQLWLETFVRATSANSVDDMATLVNNDPVKLASLQKRVFSEYEAARRDIMFMGNRVDLADGLDDAPDLAALTSASFDGMKCGRCLKNKCECGPRFRVPRYEPSDYLPAERNESTVIGEIELAQRMEAFDLLPYGDSPKGLEQGHAVRVCLPHHLLDKAYGYVLTFREVSGDYLVRSMSKGGLRDKDGVRPQATVLYVKPDALKRSRPEIVKAFSPSSDKKNNNGGTKA
jgi:hypothetical protein